MPEVFVLQPSNDHDDRLQSPSIVNNDRSTPMPYEKSSGQKPEIYHIEGKTDSESIHNEQPYRPTSSPMKSSFPTSSNGIELYHIKQADDKDNIPDQRSSPAFISNNRISPVFQPNSSGLGPEMYHIQVVDGETRRPSPPLNNKPKTTTFSDNLTSYDGNHDQRKVEVYMLTSTEKENISPPISHIQRTPSPPLPTYRSKKQEPVSYANDNKFDVPIKTRPFPTALQDVSTNQRYVLLSLSKASESIQRSMNKYRFGEN